MWYHGSPKKIDNFVDEFVGGEEANDQEGPGIYFSSNKKDAGHFGEYVHAVELSPSGIVSAEEGTEADRDELLALMRQAEDWEMKAQDWNEDPELGLELAVDSFMRYNHSQHQQFLQVWYDFFRYEPVNYVREMAKLGYDMIKIDKGVHEGEHIYHAIVLNPSIIELKAIDGPMISESHKDRLKKLSGIKKKKGKS